MDDRNSSYPDPNQAQAQSPYKISPPVPGPSIPSGVPTQRPVPAGARLPFPDPVKATFPPVIVPESTVTHDHYSEIFALDSSERAHFQKEYFSDRFALSSEDEAIPTGKGSIKRKKRGRKPGRNPKARKVQEAQDTVDEEAEEATEPPVEQQAVRRSGRKHKKVNYVLEDEIE